MIVAPLLVLALAASPTDGAPSKAHVLVVGVFHFANPQRDRFNVAVDDVLAPGRQRDVAEIVRVLRAFRPTAIAVEAPAGTTDVAERYEQYVAGTYELGASEIDQLAFRLARQLGLETVHPVDAGGDFPFDAVASFADQAGARAELDALLATVPRRIRRVQAALARGTLLDALRMVNDRREVRRDQALYMALTRFAGDDAYPGPDLAAAWYQRNARIFANVRKLVTSPRDRVLVLYGWGHLHWLQRDVIDSSDLVLDHLEPWARLVEQRSEGVASAP